MGGKNSKGKKNSAQPQAPDNRGRGQAAAAATPGVEGPYLEPQPLAPAGKKAKGKVPEVEEPPPVAPRRTTNPALPVSAAPPPDDVLDFQTGAYDKEPPYETLTMTSTGSSAVALMRTGTDRGMIGRQVAKRVNRGRIFVEVSMENLENGFFILRANVKDARDLMPMTKDGTANPYLKLSITPENKDKDSKRKSEPVHRNLNPSFGAKYEWRVPTNMDFENSRVHIQVWNSGGWKRVELIGGLSFLFNEILDTAHPTVGWYKLLDETRAETQNIPYRVKKIKEMEELEDVYGVPEEIMSGIRELSHKPKPVQRIAAPTPSKPLAIGGPFSLESLDLVRVLGRGAFGKVFLVQKKDTKEYFALKSLKKVEVANNDDVEATMAEKRVLALAAGCPFMTTMYAAFQTNEHLYYVMEFIPGGELMYHIQKEVRFPERRVQFYAAEICLALFFLHKNGVLYRDLKLDNVLLDKDGHIKLADFGLCKENIWGAGTTTTFCGTPGYLAPEVIREQPYNNSVDWWTLGVLCFELMCGFSPFDGDDEEQLFRSILESEPHISRDLTANARNFVTSLLKRKVDERLGCGRDGEKNIRAHEFFKTLDWDLIEKRMVAPPFVPANNGDIAGNFDNEYKTLAASETPEDKEAIRDLDQHLFHGFSFALATGKNDAPAEPVQNKNVLENFKWYRPELSRVDAVRSLKTAPKGAFVVRESGSQPGCFALHLSLGEGKCYHGLITLVHRVDGSILYKVYSNNKFESLMELVTYYTQHPISKQPPVMLDDTLSVK